MTNPAPNMPLLTFCLERYMKADRHPGGKQPGAAWLAAASQMLWHLELSLGRVPLVGDLTAEVLAKYQKTLAEEGHAPGSIKHRADIFLSIWRFAADAGNVLIDNEHRRKHYQRRFGPDGNIERLTGEKGTLWQIASETYFPRNIRIRSEGTRTAYRYALLDFKAFLGHEPMPDDLCDDNIVGMMKQMLDRGLSAKTANERGSRLKALWTWMAKRRLVRDFPTVPRLRMPKRVPKAWSRGDLDTLLDACRHEAGKIGTVWASDWWEALHLFLWDTGARIGEVLAVRWDWIEFATGDVIVEAEVRKGGDQDMAYRLHPDTLKALAKMRHNESEIVFHCPFCEGTLYGRYKKIRKRAGLPTDRKSAFHRIRKSVASHLHAAGHSATDVLKHSSEAITREAYLDPSITGAVRPADVLFRPGTPTVDLRNAVIVLDLSPSEARKLPRAKLLTK